MMKHIKTYKLFESTHDLMYHVSLVLNRGSIEKSGLIVSGGPTPWPEDDYPEGTYMFDNLKSARAYGFGNGDPFDVWSVSVSDYTVEDDPITRGAFYVAENIKPADISLVESHTDDVTNPAHESELFESTDNEVEKAAKAAGYNIGPVYHGTNADFTEFDPEKVNFYFRNQPMKYFFAFKEKFAADRGQLGQKMKNVLKCYVKGDIPGTYDDDDNLIPKNADHVQLGDLMISVRNPEQIKLADPITYDDDGNSIPLEKRFDPTNKDIRY